MTANSGDYDSLEHFGRSLENYHGLNANTQEPQFALSHSTQSLLDALGLETPNQNLSNSSNGVNFTSPYMPQMNFTNEQNFNSGEYLSLEFRNPKEDPKFKCDGVIQIKQNYTFELVLRVRSAINPSTVFPVNPEVLASKVLECFLIVDSQVPQKLCSSIFEKRTVGKEMQLNEVDLDDLNDYSWFEPNEYESNKELWVAKAVINIAKGSKGKPVTLAFVACDSGTKTNSAIEKLDIRHFPQRLDTAVRIASTSEDHRRMTGEQFLRDCNMNDLKKLGTKELIDKLLERAKERIPGIQREHVFQIVETGVEAFSKSGATKISDEIPLSDFLEGKKGGIWHYYYGIEKCLVRRPDIKTDWMEGRIWIIRSKSKEKLENELPGTCLIRFTTSEPGLAIETKNDEPVIIELSQLLSKQGKNMSLHEFVSLSFPDVKYLKTTSGAIEDLSPVEQRPRKYRKVQITKK